MHNIEPPKIEDPKDQIEIIQNFMSIMLENMEDLDPQFSKLVDEHFWELS